MGPKSWERLWGRRALEPREREGMRVDPTGRTGFKCCAAQGHGGQRPLLRYLLRCMLRCCCDAARAGVSPAGLAAGAVHRLHPDRSGRWPLSAAQPVQRAGRTGGQASWRPSRRGSLVDE